MKRLARTHRDPSAAQSQSEHDWAYAKRAVARGDEPEEIIRRIADFRAGEKPDPEYYARHTVAKAQAELERKTAPTSESGTGTIGAKARGTTHSHCDMVVAAPRITLPGNFFVTLPCYPKLFEVESIHMHASDDDLLTVRT